MYRNGRYGMHADFNERHAVSLCLTCDQAFFFRVFVKSGWKTMLAIVKKRLFINSLHNYFLVFDE